MLGILKVTPGHLKALRDKRDLGRMNDRLSDKTVQPVELELPAESLCPVAVRIISEILPYRSRYNIIDGKNVKNIDQNIPHYSYIVNRLPDRSSETIEITEVISSHTDIQNILPHGIDHFLQYGQCADPAPNLRDHTALEDRHHVNLPALISVDLFHERDIFLTIRQIKFWKNEAGKDLPGLSEVRVHMLHVFRCPDPHKNERPALLRNLCRFEERLTKGFFCHRQSSIPDRIFKAECNSRDLAVYARIYVPDDCFMHSGSVQKSTHHILELFFVCDQHDFSPL